MAMMKKKGDRLVFAYYVTGHGFGHATRVVEVWLFAKTHFLFLMRMMLSLLYWVNFGCKEVDEWVSGMVMTMEYWYVFLFLFLFLLFIYLFIFILVVWRNFDWNPFDLGMITMSVMMIWGFMWCPTYKFIQFNSILSWGGSQKLGILVFN